MSNADPQESQPIRIAGVDISVAEQTPLVLSLLAVIQRQEQELQALRDEIQRMKGTTQRPKISPSRLLEELRECWLGREAWEQQLDPWKLTNPEHRTRVSEAALCGTLLTESWYAELGLISDDAPQFNVFGFIHGLCWVHGERKMDRLIPLTEAHRRAKETAQGTFWELYESLKQYRLNPRSAQRQTIAKRFDQRCLTKTGYLDLNAALGLLHVKRDEFLAVLEYPHLPLHNNLAEKDVPNCSGSARPGAKKKGGREHGNESLAALGSLDEGRCCCAAELDWMVEDASFNAQSQAPARD